MSADLLARLITAGVSAELVADVAMALAEAKSDAAAIATRRQRDAARQQERRARLRGEGGAVSHDVAPNNVMSRDSADAPAPSPFPLSFPQTPKQTPYPHPHPEGFTAYTRGLAVRIVMAVVEAGCAAAKTANAKPGKRRWPATMPPPAGVPDDSWAGFIEHRKAKRNALTDHGYRLLAAKIDRHATDEWPPGRIVDTIIERGWLSFEPEWLNRQDTRHGQRTHHDRPSGPIEARRRDRERFEVESGPGDGGC